MVEMSEDIKPEGHLEGMSEVSAAPVAHLPHLLLDTRYMVSSEAGNPVSLFGHQSKRLFFVCNSPCSIRFTQPWKVRPLESVPFGRFHTLSHPGTSHPTSNTPVPWILCCGVDPFCSAFPKARPVRSRDGGSVSYLMLQTRRDDETTRRCCEIYATGFRRPTVGNKSDLECVLLLELVGRNGNYKSNTDGKMNRAGESVWMRMEMEPVEETNVHFAYFPQDQAAGVERSSEDRSIDRTVGSDGIL